MGQKINVKTTMTIIAADSMGFLSKFKILQIPLLSIFEAAHPIKPTAAVKEDRIVVHAQNSETSSKPRDFRAAAIASWV
jgi:hypothetical protein